MSKFEANKEALEKSIKEEEMLKKVLFVVLAVVLVMGLFISGCAKPAPAPAPTPAPAPAPTPAPKPAPAPAPAPTPAPAPAPTAASIVIKYAVGESAVMPSYVTAKALFTQLEKDSQGKVKFEYFPDSTVVKANDAIDGVISGICDITNIITSRTPGRFPLSAVLELPPAFVMAKEGWPTYAFFRKHLEPLKEWAEVKVLYCETSGGSQILSAKKPVRSMADLKGMRVRAIGMSAAIFEKLGATPVNLAPAEVYEAMQRGTIDATYMGAMALKAEKLVDVVKYLTDAPIAVSSGIIVMNRKKYDALPPDIKRLFDDLWFKGWSQIAMVMDQTRDDCVELLKQKGGEVVVLSPEALGEFFRTAMGTNDAWAAGLEPKGLPGKQILQARYDFLKPFMPEAFK